jgi:hypothetical protein
LLIGFYQLLRQTSLVALRINRKSLNLKRWWKINTFEMAILTL